jgi:hypothetical protein
MMGFTGFIPAHKVSGSVKAVFGTIVFCLIIPLLRFEIDGSWLIFRTICLEFKNKLYSLCLDKLSDVSQDEKNE